MAHFKDELKWLAAGLVLLIALLKIAYYRESIAIAARTAASIYWLLVIPGYAIMLHWKDNIGFLERTAIGTMAAMAITGIASYYLGLAGLKLQNQTLLLPAAIIAASAFGAKILARKKTQQPRQ
ncbi:hypothetical protein HYU18_01365 [Candidatus Woesearchaeota archaeon]|nr:hypothetical protein [Candidatus Woesearchaeota archaeon]